MATRIHSISGGSSMKGLWREGRNTSWNKGWTLEEASLGSWVCKGTDNSHTRKGIGLEGQGSGKELLSLAHQNTLCNNICYSKQSIDMGLLIIIIFMLLC